MAAEIALYEVLKRIPDVSSDEAKEAVADVANAKEVVTKAFGRKDRENGTSIDNVDGCSIFGASDFYV